MYTVNIYTIDTSKMEAVCKQTLLAAGSYIYLQIVTHMHTNTHTKNKPIMIRMRAMQKISSLD